MNYIIAKFKNNTFPPYSFKSLIASIASLNYYIIHLNSFQHIQILNNLILNLSSNNYEIITLFILAQPIFKFYEVKNYYLSTVAIKNSVYINNTVIRYFSVFVLIKL